MDKAFEIKIRCNLGQMIKTLTDRILEMKRTKNILLISKKKSSSNIFTLILCIIIGIVMLSRTWYVHQKLSFNTKTITAEVIDIYMSNHGQRLWGCEMKYKFILFNKEEIGYAAIQKNEIDKINIGDCIEIIVSLDDIKIQEWNKEKGSFNCLD